MSRGYDENKALEMMFRLLNGEDVSAEAQEERGQIEAVENLYLALEMEPEQKYWEMEGFSFEKISGDDVLCKATLPEGWIMKKTDHPMWNEIYDEKDVRRVLMFYKASFYDRNARMSLDLSSEVLKEKEQEERAVRIRK